MYTVYWYRYPHGMEDEAMTANWRDFDSLEKAINFLDGRAKLIKSINWAGGHVEDENRKWLYEIDWEGNEEDNREKFDTTDTELETATDPETADQGETAESDTKQYECENVVQVAHKVADLTKTRLDRQVWKEYCDEVKKDGSSWFDYTAFDPGGNEFDVSIFLGYDQQSRHYFVSVDYEKCPVPDMSGGA